MAKVTILINGKATTVEETSPGLFGKLGYQYVNGPTGTNLPAPETSGRGAGGNHYNSDGVIVDKNNTPIPPDPSKPTASATWINFQNRNYNLADPNDNQAYRQAVGVGSTTNNTSTNNSTTSSPVPNIPDPAYDAKVAAIINNPDLTTDQQTQLRESFRIVAENDNAAYKKMVSAYETGIAFATPVFKAQVAMVTDALTQGMKGITGDLAFREQQLTAQKGKLESDMLGANNMLDYNSEQQIKNLTTSLGQDIQTNADNMAATGKASSSVRLKSDALLNQNYQGLVESNTKTLAYNKTKNIRDTAYDVNQTNQQLKYYQDKAVADRIAKLRGGESDLGTAGLTGVSGLDIGLSGQYAPLGGINSTLEAQKYKDAFSFATNFF